jgi:hypothetical protein
MPSETGAFSDSPHGFTNKVAPLDAGSRTPAALESSHEWPRYLRCKPIHQTLCLALFGDGYLFLRGSQQKSCMYLFLAVRPRDARFLNEFHCLSTIISCIVTGYLSRPARLVFARFPSHSKKIRAIHFNDQRDCPLFKTQETRNLQGRKPDADLADHAESCGQRQSRTVSKLRIPS